jgi:hypothetical protein
MLELVSLDSFSMQQLDVVCMCRSRIGKARQLLFLMKKSLPRCLFPKNRGLGGHGTANGVSQQIDRMH